MYRSIKHNEFEKIIKRNCSLSLTAQELEIGEWHGGW